MTAPAVFGRRSGPAKCALSVIGLLVLLVLTVTVARLDGRLATLEATNQATLEGARKIDSADDGFTRRLHQLTALAESTKLTLEQTRALQPLLVQLKAAVVPAASAIATGRAGAQRSATQLATIADVLRRLQVGTLALVGSAGSFDAQGTNLLRVLDGLVTDLRASLAAAQRINAALPLPVTGNR